MSALDVVIINWNRLAETRESIARLQAWNRLSPYIRIVDSGSEDGGGEALSREFPQLDITCSPTNLGYGGGNNLALNEVDAEFVLLLNNDAEIDEDDVGRMIELLTRQPDVAIVGPVIVERSPSGERLKAGGRDISLHGDTHVRLGDVPADLQEDGVVDVDYVSGTVALLRTSALQRIGLFEEAYFFGGEMADLCERARRKGLRSVVQTSARAAHDAATAGSHRSALYPYYILRNRFLYVRRFRPLGAIALYPYWTARGLFGIVRALLRGEGKVARALCLGLTDGWFGRFGGANERVLR